MTISIKENGIVIKQRVRSEMARLRINRFLGVRIIDLRMTAMNTSPLPIEPVAISMM